MRYSMNKFHHTLLQIYNLLKILINTTGNTTYNQPTEISDDQLRESARSLNKIQRKA